MLLFFYILLVIYSFFCAASLYFKLFSFSESPEYAFFYLLFVIITPWTLLPAGFRLLTKLGIINE